jgi:hypothetical protein
MVLEFRNASTCSYAQGSFELRAMSFEPEVTRLVRS